MLFETTNWHGSRFEEGVPRLFSILIQSFKYHNRALELNNLEQGERSVAEYEEEIRRQAKFMVTLGGNLFMEKYYLKCVLEEEKIDKATYKGYTIEQNAEYKKKKALELYLAYVFMKGVKCKPLVRSMKAALDKLYKIHKNKGTYPKTLAAAM